MDLRLGERGEIGPDLFRHACRMGTRGHGLEAQGSPLSHRTIARSLTAAAPNALCLAK